MQYQTTQTNEQLVDWLNDLIALEFNAIAAYEAAIERLDDPAYTQKMGDFMGDHQRHVQQLADAVSVLGGRARERGDVKQLLTKGKVVLANIAGDKQILSAMKSNEDETNEKYEEAVRECSALSPPQISELLTLALQDERRHRDWIVATLQAL